MSDRAHAPETISRRRLITPDLARGIMLLFICGANAVTGWAVNAGVATPARSGVHGEGWANQAAVVFGDLFLHVRGLPMFAFLVGYGIGMIAVSLWRRGYPAARARMVLVWRYALLAIFGALHMVFLFAGDIMYLYGILGVVIAFLLTLKDKTLLIMAGVIFGLYALLGALGAALMGWVGPEVMETAGEIEPTASYLENIIEGAVSLASTTLGIGFQALGVLPVMLLGFVWGRKQILSRVEYNRRMLTWWVVPGAAVILLVGVPWALADVGVLPNRFAELLGMINDVVGWAVGPAAVAVIALATQGLQQRVDAARTEGGTGDEAVPGLLMPVLALGRRSMSGYVGQSVILIVLTAPYLLDLAHDADAVRMLGLALLTWLITAALAWLGHRGGHRGPLEALHRRLAYGKDGLQEHWQPAA